MSAAIGLYAGKGLALRSASSAGVVTNPDVFDIPNGGYSEVFNIGAELDWIIEIVVNTGNAAGDVTIRKGDDQSMTNTIDYDTIPVTGFRTGVWRNEGPSIGPFQLLNSTGQSIKAFLQRQINS